jgi:hypothetical protein
MAKRRGGARVIDEHHATRGLPMIAMAGHGETVIETDAGRGAHVHRPTAIEP